MSASGEDRRVTIEASAGRRIVLEFSGRPGEWFGIWSVNLLLSIMTLGIYSAWAKVRRKKYFAQHTTLAGRSFDYHATGGQILIGRIVVLVGLLAYSALSAVPVLGLVLTIAFLGLLPLLISRALRFNARMSSWSNVRFGFDGTWPRALVVYVVYPALAGLTLFLAWPFAARAIRGYAVGRHRLGDARFAFRARIGPFYAGLTLAALWVGLVYAGAVYLLVRNPLSLPADPESGVPLDARPIVLLAVAFVVGFLPARVIYDAVIRNEIFNATTIEGGHRLVSDVAPLRVVWIVLSNAAAIVLSLGLLVPWAQIRLARYYAEHTLVIPGGSLDDFAGALEARATAIGDAYSDIEGIDLGLPI